MIATATIYVPKLLIALVIAWSLAELWPWDYLGRPRKNDDDA